MKTLFKPKHHSQKQDADAVLVKLPGVNLKLCNDLSHNSEELAHGTLAIERKGGSPVMIVDDIEVPFNSAAAGQSPYNRVDAYLYVFPLPDGATSYQLHLPKYAGKSDLNKVQRVLETLRQEQYDADHPAAGTIGGAAAAATDPDSNLQFSLDPYSAGEQTAPSPLYQQEAQPGSSAAARVGQVLQQQQQQQQPKSEGPLPASAASRVGAVLQQQQHGKGKDAEPHATHSDVATGLKPDKTQPAAVAHPQPQGQPTWMAAQLAQQAQHAAAVPQRVLYNIDQHIPHDRHVKLMSLSYEPARGLHGQVAVRNDGSTKEVYVRYSYDAWTSTYTVMGRWLEGPDAGGALKSSASTSATVAFRAPSPAAATSTWSWQSSLCCPSATLPTGTTTAAATTSLASMHDTRMEGK